MACGTFYIFLLDKIKELKLGQSEEIFECTVIMSMLVSSKWKRVAPDALMPLGARTFLLLSNLSHFLGSHNKYLKESARTEARQRVGSAKQCSNCHLDKTNMDEANLYRIFIEI